MNYQSMIAQLGIGLAYQVADGSLPGIEFDTLNFSELKSLYEAERDFEKQTKILERMIPKASSFREKLYLLTEANLWGRERVQKIVFDDLATSLFLSFGSLKKIYDQAMNDEQKMVIVERMVRLARSIESVENLHHAYNRVVLKASAVRVDVITEWKSTEADIREYQEKKHKILDLMIPLIRDGNDFCLVYPLIMRDDEELQDKLFEKFKGLEMPFGQLYVILTGGALPERFEKHAWQKMEKLQLSTKDIADVLETGTILMGSDELLARKIRESDFGPRLLRHIYFESRGGWKEVDQAVIDKLKTAFTDK